MKSQVSTTCRWLVAVVPIRDDVPAPHHHHNYLLLWGECSRIWVFWQYIPVFIFALLRLTTLLPCQTRKLSWFCLCQDIKHALLLHSAVDQDSNKEVKLNRDQSASSIMTNQNSNAPQFSFDSFVVALCGYWASLSLSFHWISILFWLWT